MMYQTTKRSQRLSPRGLACLCTADGRPATSDILFADEHFQPTGRWHGQP